MEIIAYCLTSFTLTRRPVRTGEDLGSSPQKFSCAVPRKICVKHIIKTKTLPPQRYFSPTSGVVRRNAARERPHKRHPFHASNLVKNSKQNSVDHEPCFCWLSPPEPYQPHSIPPNWGVPTLSQGAQNSRPVTT